MQTQKMTDHAGMYVSLSFRNLGGGGGSSIGHREFRVSTSTAHRDYRDHDGDDFTFLLRNPKDGYEEPVAADKIISHGQVRTGYPVVPGNTSSESSSIDSTSSTSSRPSEVEDLLKAAPGTHCPRVPTPPSPGSAPAPADQGRQKNGLAKRWWLEKLAPRAKRCYGKERESVDDAAGKKTTTTTTKTKKNSSSASRGFSRDRKVAAAEETENMMKAKEDKQLVNHGKGVVGGEKAGKSGSRSSFFANKHHVAAWICTSAVNSGHAS